MHYEQDNNLTYIIYFKNNISRVKHRLFLKLSKNSLLIFDF